jgi:hypothetical protein
MHIHRRILGPLLLATGLSLAGLAGCSSDEVSSDEEARRAYLGLDKSIGKSLQLGFDGFNAASSANIPPQMTTGDEKGMLVISGQVDQGASANKGMRLQVGMTDYSDGKVVIDDKERKIDITYNTPADTTAQPALGLSLRNIPTGTFTGTLKGAFDMSGDLKGSVALDLMMTGELEDAGGGVVRRKPGTTKVTGTAKSGNGTYAVDLTL